MTGWTHRAMWWCWTIWDPARASSSRTGSGPRLARAGRSAPSSGAASAVAWLRSFSGAGGPDPGMPPRAAGPRATRRTRIDSSRPRGRSRYGPCAPDRRATCRRGCHRPGRWAHPRTATPTPTVPRSGPGVPGSGVGPAKRASSAFPSAPSRPTAAAIIEAIDSGEDGHDVGDRRQERSLVVAVWPLHVDQLAIIARSAVWAERRSTSVQSTTFQIASKNFAFSFWYWR